MKPLKTPDVGMINWHKMDVSFNLRNLSLDTPIEGSRFEVNFKGGSLEEVLNSVAQAVVDKAGGEGEGPQVVLPFNICSKYFTEECLSDKYSVWSMTELGCDTVGRMIGSMCEGVADKLYLDRPEGDCRSRALAMHTRMEVM
jgi:hypothetical protein